MSGFKRHYIVLSVLLVAGIAGSFYTLADGDPRIGAFSAGLTIGVMLAMYMVRVAEIRFSDDGDDDSVSILNFHAPRREPLPVSPDPGPGPSSPTPPRSLPEESVEEEEPEPQQPVPVNNILDFGTPDAPVEEPVPQPVAEAPVEPVEEPAPEPVPTMQSILQALTPSVGVCSCSCGCDSKSKGGYIDLCGNCRRWWQQQSLRCTCDYTTSGHCSCGAVKHEPSSWQDEFSKETLGADAA